MSFIRLSVVSKLNIPIFPNDQLALLADDQTKMASLGKSMSNFNVATSSANSEP